MRLQHSYVNPLVGDFFRFKNRKKWSEYGGGLIIDEWYQSEVVSRGCAKNGTRVVLKMRYISQMP